MVTPEYITVVQVNEERSKWWHKYAYGSWNWAWKAYFTDPETDETITEYAAYPAEAIEKVRKNVLMRRRSRFEFVLVE